MCCGCSSIAGHGEVSLSSIADVMCGSFQLEDEKKVMKRRL